MYCNLKDVFVLWREAPQKDLRHMQIANAETSLCPIANPSLYLLLYGLVDCLCKHKIL